ncbi:unnamed protein product [Thlaspi arvense]|uniref:MYB transcription factor n=1 Tax=Thlaspi arvense TaxID=13288 RepID=A0AAU9R8U1_THLAR|nr:unnamed protein product [Thlaspi arvense]
MGKLEVDKSGKQRIGRIIAMASSSSRNSRYTLSELVLGAISAIDDGNGVDIDVISESIKERYKVAPKFRRQLKNKLKKLVTLEKIEKVEEGRYKIIDAAATEATEPTQTLNPQDSTKPQERPNASFSSEEMAKITDGYAKVIAAAENLDLQAKEAFEAADEADQILHDNILLLDLARELVHRCVKGEKIVLRLNVCGCKLLKEKISTTEKKTGFLKRTSVFSLHILIDLEVARVKSEGEFDSREMVELRRNRWTPEEEGALLAGICKHGAGKWMNILDDPEFRSELLYRTNIDLKDKWRNMMIKEKSKMQKLEPAPFTFPPAKTSPVASNEHPLDRFSERESHSRERKRRRRRLKGLEMLRQRKNKWTEEEEEVLLAGIAKYGAGKWKYMYNDPDFAAQLPDRTNVDLKDKWRNMKNRARPIKENSKAQALKSAAISISPPGTSHPVSNEPSPICSSDMSNEFRFAISTINDENGSNLSGILSFIEERYEVPQNFRKMLSNSLRLLVSQEKLEKVLNRYKISTTKAAKPTQNLSPKDYLEWLEEPQNFSEFAREILTILISQGKLKKDLNRHKISELEKKMFEVAPEVVAAKLAESDYKSFIAAEAVKKAQQMQKLEEESNTVLQLFLEIHEQCALGEEYLAKCKEVKNCKGRGTVGMANNIILFEDIFVVDKLDPDGKKFDKVTRVEARSHNLEMFMHLDVNTEVYPMAVGDKFTLAMAPTLNLDGTPDTGYFTPGAKKTLADKYEYIMHGKLYKITERDGKTPKAELYVSFGGLLMLLQGDPAHISHFELDQRLFLLMRKLSLLLRRRRRRRLSEFQKYGSEGESDSRVMTKGLETLGHRKNNKWTKEEEEALDAGIAKHGVGKWSDILADPVFRAHLVDRTNINLKDKWRNMKHRESLIEKKLKSQALKSASISPNTSPVASNEPFSNSSSAMNNESRRNAMVFEAISTINDENGSDLSGILSFIEERCEVPQNFRMLLIESLRVLVSQGKLEKVRNRYKITDVGNKVLEISPDVVATRLAEAEKKYFIAVEAVKEAERMQKLAEESQLILQLCLDIHEQCSWRKDCLMWDEN